MHRIKSGASLIVPDWMKNGEVSRYLKFRNDFLKAIPTGALEPKEAETLSLLKWNRRNHSAKNPKKPEFPFCSPAFPATPAFKIEIPGLEECEIILKNEGFNHTHTHKERKAWEILLLYQNMIEQKLAGNIGDVPNMSIMASTSTADAIAYTFKSFGAPLPKLLWRENDYTAIQKMKNMGFETYTANFEEKELSCDDLLSLTKNKRGIELTVGKYAKEISRNYYDWMAYEIMNLKADIIIGPYGSGELYENIFSRIGEEVLEVNGKDQRFMGDRDALPKTSVVGVSAPISSIATKLSAKFLPDSAKEEMMKVKNGIIIQSIKSGIIGNLSKIEEVADSSFFDAVKFAKKIGINAEVSALAGIAWLTKNINNPRLKAGVLSLHKTEKA